MRHPEMAAMGTSDRSASDNGTAGALDLAGSMAPGVQVGGFNRASRVVNVARSSQHRTLIGSPARSVVPCSAPYCKMGYRIPPAPFLLGLADVLGRRLNDHTTNGCQHRQNRWGPPRPPSQTTGESGDQRGVCAACSGAGGQGGQMLVDYARGISGRTPSVGWDSSAVCHPRWHSLPLKFPAHLPPPISLSRSLSQL